MEEEQTRIYPDCQDLGMHFSHGSPVTCLSSGPQAHSQGHIHCASFILSVLLSVHVMQQNSPMTLNFTPKAEEIAVDRAKTRTEVRSPQRTFCGQQAAVPSTCNILKLPEQNEAKSPSEVQAPDSH